MSRGFEWPGSIREVYWCRSTAKLGRAWRNGAGPRWGGRTGTTAAESALRTQRFTTRVAAHSGECAATPRSPVAWAMVENSGGCCKLQIEARVSRVDALEGYWQELRGRGACTGANRAGSCGGSRRPELGKKAPSGLFQWLGVVLVECRGGVGSSSSSGPLFIGDPRGWP